MKILTIAKFHYLQTMKNRSIVLIVFVLSLMSLLGIFLRIGVQNFIPLPDADNLMFTFSTWSWGGLIFCIFHAAGLFDMHLRQRYFTSTISRPIYFWEYQLGQFLSLYYVFLTISLLSVLMMSIKALIYSSTYPPNFLLIMCNKWIDAAATIMIVLSIGFVCRKSSTLAIVFVVGILASIFSTIGDPPHPVLKVLKYILYIITPVERVTEVSDVINLGTKELLKSALESIGMVLYAGSIMILSNLYYKNKDYPLRDS